MNSQDFYTVYIFLPGPMAAADAKSLENALRSAHFETLCQQYGLDPSTVTDVLEHLTLTGSPTDPIVPFFFVQYGQKMHQTLTVERWDVAEPSGKALLAAVKASVDGHAIAKRLAETSRIFRIPLNDLQLSDLGLLFAYEIARWTAFHGKGLVRGLDGKWYALNEHQAFIPLL